MITKRFLVLVCVFSLFSCYEINKKLNKYLGAGSYVYVETYNFDISEDKLINIINSFKKKNNYYVMNNINLKDGKDSYWYFISFQKNDTIYSTWTRESSYGNTTFALISCYTCVYNLNKHGIPYKRYGVNEDLTEEENKKVIKQFESLIVEPLKERVEEYNKSKN